MSLLSLLASLGGVVMALLVAFLAYSWLVWQRNLRDRAFPGPPPAFLLGNAHQVRAAAVYAHELWLDWALRYGQVFRIYMLNLPLIVCSEPEVIARITSENWPKAPRYKATQVMTGQSIFSTLDMEMWKTDRRRISHAFAPGHIREQTGIMHRHVRTALARMEKFASTGEAFDVDDLMSRLTLDIIGSSGFGTEFGAMGCKGKPQISQWMEPSLYGLIMRLRDPLRYYFPYFFADQRTLFASCAKLREFVQKLIADHRARNPTSARAATIDDGTVERSLFEVILAGDSGKGTDLSETAVVDNVILFLLAGHDTTSHSLAFAFGELGRHPLVQQKLQAEIDSVMAAEAADTLPTGEHVKNMPYLMCVLKETLRLWPAGVGTSRVAPADTQIGKWFFPRGITVICHNFITHRQPAVWGANASEFVPDRWLDSTQSAIRTPCSWFPFSFGPRDCIGKGFSLLEQQIVVAAVLRRFDVRLKPGFAIRSQTVLTLGPVDGMMITLSPRMRPASE